MKIYTLPILAAFMFSPAIAKENSAKSTSESSSDAANTFAICAGFFSYMAESFTKENKPETATYMHTLENGAKTSALYLLAAQYQLDNPNAPRKKLIDFEPVIEGRIEVSIIRMRALEENADVESMTQQSNECVALLPVQEKIIVQLKKQWVNPDEKSP